MNADNPALDALQNLLEETTPSNPSASPPSITAIVNGIKTCGPMVSAALCWDSIEIDKDIDDMLRAAQKLIAGVKSELVVRRIELSDSEHAAVNAFCIRVVSENWKAAQEVYPDWVTPVVNALLAAGISAEIRSSDFVTPSGSEIAADILACSEIFCALTDSCKLAREPQGYAQSVREVHKAVNKAIDKLTQFHIPYEDADLIRHHVMLQAGRIFNAIVSCENKAHAASQKQVAADPGADSGDFSFDEVLRRFQTAMESFVTSIYVNSRMVN